MSKYHHVIESEVWVEVVEVARCYRLEVSELELWIDEGLVHRSQDRDGMRLIAVVDLETVGTLVRLTRVVGLDPGAIRSLRDAGSLPGLP